jgi:hypothetical protein
MSEAIENEPSSQVLDLLWGVREIAKTIGRSERATFYVLETSKIPPARRIGGRWWSSHTALRRFF